MINTNKSGYLVETKTGKIGRTIHEKGIVNGKVPVYLCTSFGTNKDLPEVKIPLAFSETAMLCDANGLKKIGFID